MSMPWRADGCGQGASRSAPACSALRSWHSKISLQSHSLAWGQKTSSLRRGTVSRVLSHLLPPAVGLASLYTARLDRALPSAHIRFPHHTPPNTLARSSYPSPDEIEVVYFTLSHDDFAPAVQEGAHACPQHIKALMAKGRQSRLPTPRALALQRECECKPPTAQGKCIQPTPAQSPAPRRPARPRPLHEMRLVAHLGPSAARCLLLGGTGWCGGGAAAGRGRRRLEATSFGH